MLGYAKKVSVFLEEEKEEEATLQTDDHVERQTWCLSMPYRRRRNSYRR
jgi:hypothetical protein